ncbi:MAG TPA: hypothetical protein PL009_04785 [Flavipsychrobacter sp.]|nr:hypothetical protein [Flavipsychrobacter sp.]
MWQKFIFYLKRYGFAELFGGILVLIGASITFYLTGNKILAAYVGALSENIGFYGTIIVGDIIKAKRSSELWTWKHSLPVLRNILLEFGGAELLDSFVMRPGMIYLFTTLFTPYEFGALVGVVVSDVVFYAMAVLSAELTRKFRK